MGPLGRSRNLKRLEPFEKGLETQKVEQAFVYFSNWFFYIKKTVDSDERLKVMLSLWGEAMGLERLANQIICNQISSAGFPFSDEPNPAFGPLVNKT